MWKSAFDAADEEASPPAPTTAKKLTKESTPSPKPSPGTTSVSQTTSAFTSRKAVLEQQQKQRRNGTLTDPDAIANAYKLHTKEAEVAAYQIAQKDHLFVQQQQLLPRRTTRRTAAPPPAAPDNSDSGSAGSGSPTLQEVRAVTRGPRGAPRASRPPRAFSARTGRLPISKAEALSTPSAGTTSEGPVGRKRSSGPPPRQRAVVGRR